MCETERHSLFCPVHVGTNMGIALNACAKMLREGSDIAKKLLLQALLNIHQSKPMRVNVKGPVKLELLKIRSLDSRKNHWGHC